MILTLLYHQVHQKGKYSNNLKLFEKHLEYIKNNFSVVLPGCSNQSPSAQVCLSFDDATFDFFHHVYPLLLEKELPCVLAVPSGKISSKANSSPEERLQLLLNPSRDLPLNNESYCSWEEIQEMSQSPFIKIASHSHSHVRCDDTIKEFEEEIIHSKKIIESNIQKKIDSFVYPYGKFSPQMHKKIRAHYKYIFRIGNSLNINWSHPQNLYFRCNADNLENPQDPFSFQKKITYLSKTPVNYLKALLI
jgi:peptidoglycan/xylan/chitin deacetylase (PgdA/CDA1 family)